MQVSDYGAVYVDYTFQPASRVNRCNPEVPNRLFPSRCREYKRRQCSLDHEVMPETQNFPNANMVSRKVLK